MDSNKGYQLLSKADMVHRIMPYLDVAITLVRNIRRCLVVVIRRSVIVPPERKMLRHSAIDLALGCKVREHRADHVSIIRQRA